jgi:hypothetical protein
VENLRGAVINHGKRYIKDDGKSNPGQPAETLQEPRDQAGGDAHEGDRDQETDGKHHGMRAGGAGDGEHVVQTHGDVRDDDAPDGGAQTGRWFNVGVVSGMAQFARGFPDHPEEQDAARKGETDKGEHFESEEGEADADDGGARDARPDGAAALDGWQSVDGEADDDGVVAGQHKVDKQDLQQNRGKGENCIEIHKPNWLVLGLLVNVETEGYAKLTFLRNAHDPPL